MKELNARESDVWDNTDITKARKTMETARAAAVEALRLPRYFVKQADWLQERFPDAKLRAGEVLANLVARHALCAAYSAATEPTYDRGPDAR